jgi:uncharacterized membrane protein YphA (DoxX/SURF4 family)
MSRLILWLLHPGDTSAWPPLVARLVLAAMFVPAGLGKFLNHDTYIERFDRWGFPEPGSVAYMVGAVEVVFGLLMLLGVLPRLAGLVLAGNMAGAFLTAGLVDGGRDLWLPPVLAVLALFVAWVGAGRLSLHRRVVPAVLPGASADAR